MLIRKSQPSTNVDLIHCLSGRWGQRTLLTHEQEIGYDEAGVANDVTAARKLGRKTTSQNPRLRDGRGTFNCDLLVETLQQENEPATYDPRRICVWLSPLISATRLGIVGP